MDISPYSIVQEQFFFVPQSGKFAGECREMKTGNSFQEKIQMLNLLQNVEGYLHGVTLKQYKQLFFRGAFNSGRRVHFVLRG